MVIPQGEHRMSLIMVTYCLEVFRKTTLMDVLAGRKTGGYIEGDIRISGYPKNQKTFARISGYCEQNDIHSPQITIRESLIYSAWLRLAKDVDDATKMVK
jgi:ABC-type multidrug transport system ATPase subunit